MRPRQAACWFQSVSGSHLLVWIWGCDAFRSQRKKTYTQAHSLQIFYLITGLSFFCAHFLATSRMSCFAIILSAGVCSAEIPGCVILQLKKKKNLSEALKHFLFPPLHECTTEQTVSLKLNSHSFIYMVNDCPFLAKKDTVFIILLLFQLCGLGLVLCNKENDPIMDGVNWDTSDKTTLKR